LQPNSVIAQAARQAAKVSSIICLSISCYIVI
jgi:hypothetical protein